MTNSNPYGGFGFQRPSFGESMKNFFRQKSVLNWLITINVGLWLMVAFSNLFMRLYQLQSPNALMTYLSLPANLSVLAHRPWTAVTYMVLHNRFGTLLLNMAMLWLGGLVFRNQLTEKQLLLTYLVGGLVGAVFFVVAYQIFPIYETAKLTATVWGSTAAVMAVLAAAVAYSPDNGVPLLLLGRTKFFWVLVVYIVIDLVGISPENAGTYFAHLGGALYGFIYGLLLRNGIKVQGPKRRKPKMEYTPYEEVYDEPQVPRSDEEYNYQKAEKERNMDAILDKIAKSGYASLTAEEKEYLFKNSRS